METEMWNDCKSVIEAIIYNKEKKPSNVSQIRSIEMKLTLRTRKFMKVKRVDQYVFGRKKEHF